MNVLFRQPLLGDRDSAVLELNEQTAGRLGGPSRVVTVPGATHLFEEPARSTRSFGSPRTGSPHLRERGGAIANVEPVVRVNRGSAAREIAEAAQELEADLIILTVSDKHGPTKTVLGSTVEEVLRDAERDVLVVPAGLSFAS